MEPNYGDDFITITDEDGVEYELEVLSRLDYEDHEYLALIPAGAEDDEDAELEISILKAVEENGEEILVTVDDEDELEAVYKLFMELAFEEDDE